MQCLCMFALRPSVNSVHFHVPSSENSEKLTDTDSNICNRLAYVLFSPLRLDHHFQSKMFVTLPVFTNIL